MGLQAGPSWNTLRVDKMEQTPFLLPGTKVSPSVEGELLPAGFHPRLRPAELVQALRSAFGSTSGLKDCSGTVSVRGEIEALQDLWRLCNRQNPLLASTPPLRTQIQSMQRRRRLLQNQIQALPTDPSDENSQKIKEEKQTQISLIDEKLKPLYDRSTYTSDYRSRITALLKRRIRKQTQPNSNPRISFADFCEVLGMKPWHQLVPAASALATIQSAGKLARKLDRQRTLAKSQGTRSNAKAGSFLSLGLLQMSNVQLLEPPSVLYGSLSARAAALNPELPSQTAAQLLAASPRVTIDESDAQDREPEPEDLEASVSAQQAEIEHLNQQLAQWASTQPSAGALESSLKAQADEIENLKLTLEW